MGKSLEFTTQEQLGHVCDFVICDCVSEFDDGGNGIGGGSYTDFDDNEQGNGNNILFIVVWKMIND